jgi:hypothetical protein
VRKPPDLPEPLRAGRCLITPPTKISANQTMVRILDRLAKV